MHPFSGRLIKNWPIENFMQLASWLTGDMGAAVVLLGTKSDAESLPSLAEMAESANANSLVGETSLQEAIAIISQADLYIGNDSGLTHVAARLDIPSLAIFSGVAPIENWAPFGKDVTIIHAPVECAPCSLPPSTIVRTVTSASARSISNMCDRKCCGGSSPVSIVNDKSDFPLSNVERSSFNIANAARGPVAKCGRAI